MPTDPNDVRTNDLEKWLYPAAGAMHEWRGSYLGFTYNGKHSSEFGIVRTSTSNRYDDNLLPNKNVKTTAVPGGDGAYYFGSNYTQRQFTVQFAFDALFDVQLRKMRQWLGTGEIHDLIFDEFPYKVYSAAVTGNATAKHLCFDEGSGVVYKGDGSIQFTCYFPFARSRYKWLSQYTTANIPEWGNDEFYNNKTEWAVGSGMLESANGKDSYIPSTAVSKVKGVIPIFNPGDLPTDFRLFIPGTFFASDCTIVLASSRSYTVENPQITIGSITGLATTEGIMMDTKTHLLRKYEKTRDLETPVRITNELYNHYIVSGDFFQIPQTDPNETMYIVFKDYNYSGTPAIEYNYLYY